MSIFDLNFPSSSISRQPYGSSYGSYGSLGAFNPSVLGGFSTTRYPYQQNSFGGGGLFGGSGGAGGLSSLLSILPLMFSLGGNRSGGGGLGAMAAVIGIVSLLSAFSKSSQQAQYGQQVNPYQNSYQQSFNPYQQGLNPYQQQGIDQYYSPNWSFDSNSRGGVEVSSAIKDFYSDSSFDVPALKPLRV